MPINLSNAWQSGVRIVNFVISLLPNIILAIIILVFFILLASAAKSLVRRFSQRHGKQPNLGLLLGQLAHATVAIFGVLVAISAVAPSFHVSDLIKMLGVGTVAIGFAFQNILQNFLAGILLLVQQPFRVGDWIVVTGFEGRVEDIQAHATIVVDRDAKRIVIPNAVLFTNPVVVGEAAPAGAEQAKIVPAQAASKPGNT